MSAIAARYDTLFLRWYARSKLATDPLYDAVAKRLRGHPYPVVDIGCGIGLMAFHLREQGFAQPITGIDHDAMKIAEASRAAYDGIRFTTGDARDAIPVGSSVLLLDVLHYFDAAEQSGILENVARAVPPGGVAIIRDAVRDGSWRYRATYAAELFARGIHWIRAERLEFPMQDRIVSAFDGFDAEVTPLWGSTPFNNYLFVFTKRG
ncbi:MAG TPA: class I SAM-dependent methyltransferase [Thermoanaerobaculia bacterium]|nr:class I SAM-dependent methyltransferase [Thermoanaerobaculia bacterium]